MSVCRRGIDLLGTMNIGLNILQDIQSSFFRTFIHLPGKKRGDLACYKSEARKQQVRQCYDR